MGMLTAAGGVPSNELIENLIDAVWTACKEESNTAHEKALWRTTAMLISLPGNFVCYLFIKTILV